MSLLLLFRAPQTATIRNIHVKSSNVWTTNIDTLVKHNNVWVTPEGVYTKVNGAWQKVWGQGSGGVDTNNYLVTLGGLTITTLDGSELTVT